MSFVLDNSITMRWFFGDGGKRELAYATQVLDALAHSTALVPITWGLEVSNVLARAEAQNLVLQARSDAFLNLLSELDIAVDDATFAQAFSGTLNLARRYRLSSYDASYLELSLREGVALATLDQSLKKAATKAGVALFPDMKSR